MRISDESGYNHSAWIWQQALIEPSKIQDYLLSSTHPTGRFKAVFFNALGFYQDNWHLLETEIRRLLLPQHVLYKCDTAYGRKYEVRGEITGPAGKKAHIITAWIVLRTEKLPRFITAYPGG